MPESEIPLAEFVIKIPADYWDRVDRVQMLVGDGTPFSLTELAAWLGLEPEPLAYLGPVAFAIVVAMQAAGCAEGDSEKSRGVH